MGLNKNIKIIINYWLGPLLFVLLSYSLYLQIANKPDLPMRWQQIKEAAHNPMLWLIVLLMFLNWGIEAKKWQILVAPLEKINLLTAFKSVLAGCSVTMLTPNRVGEYGGRILYIKPHNRLKAIAHNILGSMSQLFITLLMGICGLIYLKYFAAGNSKIYELLPAFAINTFLYLSIGITTLLILLYFRVGFIVKMIYRSGVLKKFVKYIEHLANFERKQLLRILFLSFFRYLVFILQYMLMLHILFVAIPAITCFWLLSVFYLAMVMAPSIGFTELPLRAAASVQILQLFSDNIAGMQAASLGIWLINLVTPAIIGSLLIFGLKIMKDK